LITKLKTVRSAIYSFLPEKTLNYSINQNSCYILIIPGFGIISTVISASSNKNVFGQDGPLIKLKAECTAPSANFNFDDFNIKYTSIYGNSKNAPSFEFLSWFIEKSKTGFTARLRFTINQHSRDILLTKSFIQYLNCGRVSEDSIRSIVRFEVTKLSDIIDKIIPLFEKSPLKSSKALNYADFCKVAELMQNKAHLTEEGLNQIKMIKI
jgi:hypothetical protein